MSRRASPLTFMLKLFASTSEKMSTHSMNLVFIVTFFRYYKRIIYEKMQNFKLDFKPNN